MDPVLAEQRRQNAAAKDAETARLQARPATHAVASHEPAPHPAHCRGSRAAATPQAERAARVRERVQKADAEEQRRLAVRAHPLSFALGNCAILKGCGMGGADKLRTAD